MLLVPPDFAAREAAMSARAKQGGLLTDRAWQERVLDETWRRLPTLGEWGYAYAKDKPQFRIIRHNRRAPQGKNVKDVEPIRSPKVLQGKYSRAKKIRREPPTILEEFRAFFQE